MPKFYANIYAKIYAKTCAKICAQKHDEKYMYPSSPATNAAPRMELVGPDPTVSTGNCRASSSDSKVPSFEVSNTSHFKPAFAAASVNPVHKKRKQAQTQKGNAAKQNNKYTKQVKVKVKARTQCHNTSLESKENQCIQQKDRQTECTRIVNEKKTVRRKMQTTTKNAAKQAHKCPRQWYQCINQKQEVHRQTRCKC